MVFQAIIMLLTIIPFGMVLASLVKNQEQKQKNIKPKIIPKIEESNGNFRSWSKL